MNKFSLSKLDREFNDVIWIDFMYWKKWIKLHAVGEATGYSELSVISARKLDVILRALDKIWFLAHGSPTKIRGDQGFDQVSLRDWMSKKRSKLVPVPSRRHNKTCIVERTNRVVKNVLEKIDEDKTLVKMSIQ